MPPKSKKRGRGKAKSEEASDIDEEAPPPPPPRPFREVEGLPLSIDEPSYSILNNALSLKDSAVLYTSLMRSRKAYTNGNIFDLYWAKGKTKFDNDVNARDRMNKFCECVLTIGPHTYDMRFFILKNDEIEKKRQDEKDKKKEKRMAAKKEREEKQKLRELKKARQDALDNNIPGQLPPPSSSIEQPPTGGVSTAPPSNVTANDAGTSPAKDDAEDNDDSDKEIETNTSLNGETTDKPESTPQAEPEARNEEEIPSKVEATPTPSPEPKLSEQTQDKKTPESPYTKPLPPLQVPNQISPQGKSHERTSSPQPQILSKPQQPQESQPKTQPQPQPQSNQIQSTPGQQPLPRAPQPPPPQPPSQQAQNDIMQTPESQMMIANLNAIARKEPSLNALMKVVATGNAKPEEIREFQGYIQRAKAMGPTPYYHQAFPNQPPLQQPQSLQPPKPPKKIKPPKQPKPVKEKQLTTFQEMYVDGADLVFEFNENPNIRYHLPKDSIIEQLPNGEILVSTLVIHNRIQIKKWDLRQKAKLEKKELEEKEKKESEVKEEDPDEELVEKEPEVKEKPATPAKQRRTRKTAEKEAEEKDAQEAQEEENRKNATKEENLRKEKEIEEQRKIKEAEESDKRPIPYFSAISFTLSQIEERYFQIFRNSFNKTEEVKTYMEEVLKTGIRVPKHYLWYSVDAYEDEQLAEGLRESLFLLENPVKGKAAYKKRAIEDVASGTPTGKRVKKEA